MRLGESQDFASPEEALKALEEADALEHHGVKGMRKQEETFDEREDKRTVSGILSKRGGFRLPGKK